ncbi:probable serine incorporator, partial [Tanacetum coccineum]
VNGSLLPAAVISVYCAYVCYTGLAAEPRDYACNGLNSSKAVTTEAGGDHHFSDSEETEIKATARR